MSTAHTEAVAMGALTAALLVITAVAFRVGRQTGQPSQWRWLGPILAAVTLSLAILNLNGVVFSGVGGR